jgi:hypothetical protein
MIPRFVRIKAPRPGPPSSALQVQSPLTLPEMASYRGDMLAADAAASAVVSDRST